MKTKSFYIFITVVTLLISIKTSFSQNAVITFSVTSPICNGDNNGSVCATVSGGNAPYSYSWSNSGSTTNCITSISAGVYSLTVTDANSIITTSIVNVTEPSQLFVFDGYCGKPCYAATNGTFCVQVNGGTPPYTFAYSGQTYSITYSFCNYASAGTYSYTITDYNGCILSDTTLITSYLPTTAVINYTNASCASCCDGIVEVIPTNTNVTCYLMDSLNNFYNSPTNTFTNVCSGGYTINVGSSFACHTIYMNNLPHFFLDSLSATPDIFARRTAIHFINAQKDTASLSILDALGSNVLNLFSDSIMTSANHLDSLRMDNYPNGVYYVFLKLGHRKTLTKKIIKQGVVGLKEFNKESQLVIYPNPTDGLLNIESNTINGTAEIKIIDVLGHLVLLTTTNTNHSILNIYNLNSGIYFIELKTNQCIVRKKFFKE